MSGDAARFQEVRSIFDGAHELSGDERERFLDNRCGADEELRREVEGLLAALASEGTDLFSDRGLAASREALEELVDTGANDSGWLPERIAGYRILRRIGQGGMGLVFEALQESPRRHVAIKLLRPQDVTDARRKRFRQEAELLGRLHHPGIARIFEAGTFDLGQGEQPFFAMELVEGLDVCLYAEQERFGVRERLTLVAKIADAVHHAHERGIVHRDLKPDNVLVDRFGQPKVLDFGVARADESTDVVSTLLTQEGVLLGTLPYMAPELLGGEPATARADVYALGVLAFRLLTGCMPHEIGGLQVAAAIRVMMNGPRLALSAAVPSLRGDVETIVEAALAAEPAQRYETAQALASDLRRHLQDLPILARPPSRLYRLRKYGRRNRALVTIAVVTGVAAVLSSVLAAYAMHKRAEAELAEYSSRMDAVGLALEKTDFPSARRLLEDLNPRLRGWPWEVCLARTSPAPHRVVTRSSDEATHLAASEAGLFWVDVGTSLRAFDLASGQALWRHDFESPVRPRAVSGESARTVLAQLETGFLAAVNFEGRQIWKRATYPEKASSNRPTLLAFPDSEEFRLTLVDVETGEVVAQPWIPDRLLEERGLRPGHPRNARSLVTSDRRRVVVGRANCLEVFEFDGEELHPIGAAEGYRSVEKFNLGGDQWVSAGSGVGQVRVWSLDSLEIVADLRLPTSEVLKTQSFSPNGRLLVVGGRRDSYVFETDTWEIVESLVLDGAIAAEPLRDGRIISLHVNGEVREWDSRQIDTYVLGSHDGFAYALEVASEGRVYSGGWDFGAGAIRAWDATSGEAVARLGEEGEVVHDLALARDGRKIAVAQGRRPRDSAREGTLLKSAVLRLADTATGAQLWSSIGTYTGVAFEPSGRRIAAVGLDGLAILDAETGEPLQEQHLALPAGHARIVVDWERSGLLAMALYDRVEVWDADRFAPVAQRSAEGARAVRFSPDGTVVAVGTEAGRISILDAETLALRTEWIAHAGGALCAEFRPDGTLLATGGRDGVVRIWDVANQRSAGSFPGHDEYVKDVAWSADGETLWSASGDGTVRMWTPLTRSELAQTKQTYEQLVKTVEPEVLAVLETARDVESAAARIEAREDWSAREREVAGQVLLREVVDARE